MEISLLQWQMHLRNLPSLFTINMSIQQRHVCTYVRSSIIESTVGHASLLGEKLNRFDREKGIVGSRPAPA